jgi:hypothetical protein
MADSKGLEEVPEGMSKYLKKRQQEEIWQWLHGRVPFCAVDSMRNVEQNINMTTFRPNRIQLR